SPTGRVPCLLDGETVVWDSLAILEYLAEIYPFTSRSASSSRHA
ncbi:glutathione S-transferase N-terminal domain-containing protein, partial [Gemmobacter caeni]